MGCAIVLVLALHTTPYLSSLNFWMYTNTASMFLHLKVSQTLSANRLLMQSSIEFATAAN